MGVRLASVGQSSAAAITLPTTSETLILTVGPLSPCPDNAQVLLFWWVEMTPGAATTTMTIKLYRAASISGGAFVIHNNKDLTVGNVMSDAGCWADSPGIVGGQSYTMSVTQALATGNGSVTNATLIAMVL